MVLDASLLKTQHYKVQIKSKVGTFRSPSTTIRKQYLAILNKGCKMVIIKNKECKVTLNNI